MTWNMKIIESEKKGEENMLALIERLIEDKRFNDISIIKENKQYRQTLYKEYGILS